MKKLLQILYILVRVVLLNLKGYSIMLSTSIKKESSCQKINQKKSILLENLSW